MADEGETKMMEEVQGVVEKEDVKTETDIDQTQESDTSDLKKETEEVPTKTEVEADANGQAIKNEEDDEGSAADAAAKAEQELEQQLKDTQISIARYAPHTIPDWDLQDMRERWMWNLKIFPIDQEDCRNCLLDSATKIAQECWYYVPKRKNGQGTAELVMANANEAKQVMARVVRMPFYHRYVTIEINQRKNPEKDNTTQGPFKEIVEKATVVIDSTKCERIKNTAKSTGSYL